MKPKRNYKTSIKAPAPLDFCQTPPYAVAPLLQFIPRDLVIWDPCCGEGILANALRVAGYKVVESDIMLGQDFFDCKPPRFNVIVTNPPYGIKPAWTERCYMLNKPFALLMPTEFQGTGAAVAIFKHYEDIEIMNIVPRVDFKMPNEGWFSSAQFPVAWYCRGILPNPLWFERIHKPPRTATRQVMKKGKLITEHGYAEWIERPILFDREDQKFVYQEL